MTTFLIGVGLGFFTGACIGLLAGALMHDAKRETPPIPVGHRAASHIKLVPAPREQQGTAS